MAAGAGTSRERPVDSRFEPGGDAACPGEPALRGRRAGFAPLLGPVVLERDSESDPELGDLAVGNRHVLPGDLGDAQIAHRLAHSLELRFWRPAPRIRS